MKKWMTLALLFASVLANAQTADEIIQKYTSAMGGLEAFNKVNSAKMTGTVTTAGRTLPLTTQLINGRAMRMDVEAVGQLVINVYNNGKGWKINPFAGAALAKEVTGTELAGYKAQASLSNHLMDYKNRGHQVEFIGEETVNGAKVYNIKLINKDDGKTTNYFIDATTYLLVKSTTRREISGTTYDSETTYSDLRDINGLKFCMHMNVTAGGKPYQELKYEKVELNVPVDEKIFIKPN